MADEEGSRFGVACMGSRLLSGAIDPATAMALRDAAGTTLGEAMAAAGVDPAGVGPDETALARIGAFVELHVEQGRALVDLGAAVGVATAIRPHGRWRVRLDGQANHAGTTRLVDRHDPMLPFAVLVRAARDVAGAHDSVATVGRATIVPNGTNAVPSRVDAWLDLRGPDDATVARCVDEVTERVAGEARAHGVALQVVRESYSPQVTFDPELRERMSEVLGGVPQIPTGAGHDAGVLAARVPTGMLFVRNATGVSHSPAEHAERDDCLAGVQALATVLADLVGG
jgi:N-carbamoyl-L-amino-acid hydrolase